jgi:hypothetical protein
VQERVLGAGLTVLKGPEFLSMQPEPRFVQSVRVGLVQPKATLVEHSKAGVLHVRSKDGANVVLGLDTVYRTPVVGKTDSLPVGPVG